MSLRITNKCLLLGQAKVLAIALLLVTAATGSTRAQMVDLNHNGMSDIWEAVFNAAGLDPNVDTDGDGVINRLEAIAGTNPFDPNSSPKISSITCAGNSVSINIVPSALGKQYQLLSLPGLGASFGTNWTIEATTIARTGSVVTLSVPVNQIQKFFRVTIADVDSDGDGVNDWEEYQLGLDPLNAYSNGQLDANGQPMNDYTYVTSAYKNSFALRAIVPTATQPGPGLSAVNQGAFTLTRAGVPLRAVTVNLSLANPGLGIGTEGVDFAVLPHSVTFPVGVSSQTFALVPLFNTNLTAPVLAAFTVQPATNYSVGSPSSASVLVYPSPVPFGTGLTGSYFTNSSPNYADSANFNSTNLVLTRIDPVINFVWGNSSTPIANNGNYTVRWTGQVQPQYSEPYTFVANTGDGVRLWINDQRIIDNWSLQAGTSSATVNLLEGVRYNIRMEYFNYGGTASAQLSWSSPSQPQQVIPAIRLYPASVAPGPTVITSPLTAIAFVGQPFSYTATAVNSPFGFTASALPSGLSFDSTHGVISGTPGLTGDYQVTLIASNATSWSASVLDLQVVDPTNVLSGQVAREIWTAIPGTNVADIPVNTAAAFNTALNSLEGVTNYGKNYGERIRGYLTPPATGNYYFWIAASDSAELWIANDSEPVNKVRRAFVLNGTAPRQWNLQPNQKSPWLALVAGQRYYVEVLHKAGVGTNDNFAVGWIQDSNGNNTAPSGVVLGPVLSPYFAPPPGLLPGTLYAASMLSASGAFSLGFGLATLRLSADGSTAVLNLTNTALSSAITGKALYSDADLGNPGQLLFDIKAASPQADGSYFWTIGPVGSLAAADIVSMIKEGEVSIVLKTLNYPAGEISGHLSLATGTQSFTPPPSPLSWTDDHADPNAASRFLIQATFGSTLNEMANVQAMGYAGWINNQLSLPASHHLPYVLANTNLYPGNSTPLAYNSWWQQSITAPDQLRQRVAFALSEILVISTTRNTLFNRGDSLCSYYDILLDNAFGNYRDLLKSVTLSPGMGLYLDMMGNNKGDPLSGTHANQNYAREVLQLFSIGLNRQWPDGTLVLNSAGNLVPTYGQDTIMGFASVFTGWYFHQTNQSNGRLPLNWYYTGDGINPMTLAPSRHETGTKLLLDNIMLAAAQGSQTDPASTNYDNYGLQELDAALDSIFNNQNVGPFICRQLIQRLVTSNPSPDYVYRVTKKFNDNGFGVRGDLQAVIKAILLDYEARSSAMIAVSTYGKQREPLLRATAVARAFPAQSTWNIAETDLDYISGLAQTPQRAPSVFNFFRPNYRFPGPLAAAGLTTPEFQLTVDTTVISQLNFLTAGILSPAGQITSLSSFANGNGAIAMDVGPWITTNNTSNAGIAGVIDQFNTLVLGGQLSAGAKNAIVTCVTDPVSFPYSAPPTFVQMRDRAQAIVHLIVTSPDFTIQK